MITRALALAGGVAGAAALSQYPEFSQQYVQRLAGQVEALTLVAADFDASAARSGLTRQAALEQMGGTAFLEDRRADMERSFLRLERLSADQAMLATASPVERIFMPQRLRDTDLLAGTWADFKPAVPLTTAGAVAAGLGFGLGWLGLGFAFGGLGRLARRLFRRNRDRQVAPARIEPSLR